MRPKRVVLLAGDRHIAFADPATARCATDCRSPPFSSVSSARVLSTDGCDRIVLAGVDSAAVGGRSRALVIAAAGERIADVAFDGAPTGATLVQRQLHVTTAAGLLRFNRADGVPAGGGEVDCQLLTPTLVSVAPGPQRWLRLEAEVTLPAGSALT